MKRAALLLSFCFYCLIDASPAHSQPACDTRVNILAHLGQKYSESPSAVGLAANGELVEVLTSDDGSTWTLIVSKPGGLSCLLAAGEEWQRLERVTVNGPAL